MIVTIGGVHLPLPRLAVPKVTLQVYGRSDEPDEAFLARLTELAGAIQDDPALDPALEVTIRTTVERGPRGASVGLRFRDYVALGLPPPTAMRREHRYFIRPPQPPGDGWS